MRPLRAKSWSSLSHGRQLTLPSRAGKRPDVVWPITWLTEAAGATPIGADFRPRLPPFGAEPAVAGASVAPRFPEKAACRVVDSADSVAPVADSPAPLARSKNLSPRGAEAQPRGAQDPKE